MKKKMLIVAPSYDELNGGSIVLHKLCHLINECGREAYITPYFETFELNRFHPLRTVALFVRRSVKPMILGFKTNPHFNTPILKLFETIDWSEWVVVYPEIVFGNPLGAVNVVRWFLHNPGFHTGKIYYGSGELYFKFNGAIKPFDFPGSVVAKDELKVIHYPLEYYNMIGVASERHGIAYTIRKGAGKRMQHESTDSILIDGKSHAEVARIFKNVKTFISYDTYTAYSIFAVLCGCDSVVIPDEGVSQEVWYPNPEDRYGIAYGLENITQARMTSSLVLGRVVNEEAKSIKNVMSFIDEVENYFA